MLLFHSLKLVLRDLKRVNPLDCSPRLGLFTQCSENDISSKTGKLLKSFHSVCTQVTVLQASTFIYKAHSVHRPIHSALNEQKHKKHPEMKYN